MEKLNAGQKQQLRNWEPFDLENLHLKLLEYFPRAYIETHPNSPAPFESIELNELDNAALLLVIKPNVSHKVVVEINCYLPFEKTQRIEEEAVFEKNEKATKAIIVAEEYCKNQGILFEARNKTQNQAIEMYSVNTLNILPAITEIAKRHNLKIVNTGTEQPEDTQDIRIRVGQEFSR